MRAQSKKSKSSNKGTSLVGDTNLFEGGGTAPTTAAAAALTTAAAAAAIAEKKRDSDSLPMPPPIITSPTNLSTGTDPFSNLMSANRGDDGWEGSDFFKENSFALSPFETDLASGDNGGSKDSFGFPTKPISDGVMGNKPSRTREATNAFFDLSINGADSWGAPTAILPVDITPRRDNAARHFNDHRHDNVDANSYDTSEMSEVTDPTFSSSSIMVTARLESKGINTKGNDKNVKTVDNSDSSIKENHNRESSRHSGGRKKNLPSSSVSASPTEKHRMDKSGVNVDPPIASLDMIESSEDERENKNRGLGDQVKPTSTLPVAKSRILSKYAKSGKVRRAVAYSSSVDNDKTEPQSSVRSIGSVGSSSLNSRTGNLRQELEMSHAKTSKTLISADLNPARMGYSSSVDNDKTEPQSSVRSIGSVGSSSLNSRTGNLRQELEMSHAKTSKTLISADLNPARMGNATATSAAASAIALAAVPSIGGGISQMKEQQQQPHSHQKGISPTRSSSFNRHRQSPMRASTSSTTENTSPVKSISSPSRSPVRIYSSPNRKMKVSPSAVENPAYYSVRFSHFLL